MSDKVILFDYNRAGTDELITLEKNVPFIIESPFERLKNKIVELSELENDWDCYGALKPFSEVIDNSESLRNILNNDFTSRIEDVYPNPHGTISFVWLNKQGEKLSLEMGRTKYSYFVRYNDSKPKQVDKRDIGDGFKELLSDLAEFYRKEIPNLIF